ncbi:MAG TPA: MotA/TolQ/ExbB proton channel family protein [Kofleriaceae bacterium]|nr:MotA/TolQ/ExbB proton channel family protein [Kofleriaceae bacterium]
MQSNSGGLVELILELPIFEAEWVLWLLIGLSLVSVLVMIERVWFYNQHAVDVLALRAELRKHITRGQFAEAARMLERHDSMESNVVLAGLREYSKGPESVEEALVGAETMEVQRYQKRLGFLATVGSNAPFIGLFGTVLGVIKAFAELGADFGAAGGELMNGISEALVATGVGLLVAIPAVIAYNTFSARVKRLSASTQLLSRTLLVELKAEEPPRAEAA